MAAFKAQTCFYAFRLLHKAYRAGDILIKGVFLGILDRENFHALDAYYYDLTSMYRDRQYNLKGLFPWEETCVTVHFKALHEILVIGAGGGRETLALLRSGFHVDAYECNRALAVWGSRFLEEQGYPVPIHPMPRDVCPPLDKKYDGAIIGWDAYQHIPGKTRRVSLLKSLRSGLKPRAPLLLSFWTRGESDRSHRTMARIANGLRRFRRKAPVETGDTLNPNFSHCFTEEEIREELEEAGFSPARVRTLEEPHAVAFASKQS